MWINPAITHTVNEDYKNSDVKIESIDTYDEDDTTTEYGTSSTVDHIAEPLFFAEEDEESLSVFETKMKNPYDTKITRYKNTYFMDGGNRFISLPTLGNTSTGTASHISRIFEDWLQHKLYQSYDGHLPILEDSVELVAEDIVNKLKSRNCVKGLTGLARIFIKIRTGHIYTYHSLEDNQPLITADMEDFFQQFPLFVEIVIYTMPRENSLADHVQLLLNLENITVNSSLPYQIRQDIHLVA